MNFKSIFKSLNATVNSNSLRHAGIQALAFH